MSIIQNPQDKKPDNNSLSSRLQRRTFLKYAGASAAFTTLLLTGCNDDDDGKFNGVVDTPLTPPTPPGAEFPAINLGSGDVGILNYAYALEQLETAFYDLLVTSTAFATTFTNATERAVLTGIRDHEVAHRDFIKAALGNDAIPALTPDFSLVNVTDRDAVLLVARTFEDIGVGAYNGAGKLLTTAANLALAGKIVSVEARHAAEIREMIEQNTFAARGNTANPGEESVITDMGLDLALTPTQVLALAQPFIKNSINASSLPTS